MISRLVLPLLVGFLPFAAKAGPITLECANNGTEPGELGKFVLDLEQMTVGGNWLFNERGDWDVIFDEGNAIVILMVGTDGSWPMLDSGGIISFTVLLNKADWNWKARWMGHAADGEETRGELLAEVEGYCEMVPSE